MRPKSGERAARNSTANVMKKMGITVTDAV